MPESLGEVDHVHLHLKKRGRRPFVQKQDHQVFEGHVAIVLKVEAVELAFDLSFILGGFCRERESFSSSPFRQRMNVADQYGPVFESARINLKHQSSS